MDCKVTFWSSNLTPQPPSTGLESRQAPAAPCWVAQPHILLKKGLTATDDYLVPMNLTSVD